ncbi:hypothetical protein Agabi119p4_1512 [Agaricus bisporus var. burnettii]|uniref:Vps53 N-terminal domain-containing protein n=1 Tax=Agaricus bisporus var. burnettii TaxID=192524 RepID=A0A8H7F7B2_AGABI|nr:hypothetical protein Agabi119p4_1512 [Agaricus bisporus var. burnettii]
MQTDELPHEIVLAIERALESAPENQEFNPLAIINELFPNEASLAYIDSVDRKLNETQSKFQKEIDELQEELKKNQDPERMSMIQEMISDLLGQMSRIREKATESEAVVRNITKDIQVLDLAKKNLILSMTVLRRLQMLVNAMTQLQDYIKEKRYKEVSESLATVKEISATFKQYTSVQRISRVWKRIQELQGELRTQLDADFDAFFLQDSTKQVKPALITQACLVVDVLGSDFRTHLIDRHVALELKEYRRIFKTNDEAGQLDNISRRFAWFRRLIQNHELEQGRVFPSLWRVGWYLLAKFAEITRDDISALLSKAASNMTVKTLLDYLQQTIEFELSMAKKWATPFAEILKFTNGSSQPQKVISSSFEPHLGIFVDAQDKVLAEMLAPHRKKGKPPPRTSLETNRASTEENADDEPPIVVLPSSTELFYLYGQSLEQCAKLSTGQTLFDLCNLHKKWLRIYAEDVLSLSNPKQRPTTRRSMESRFDINEIKRACLIINTADYCQTTASELEEKIKEKINEDFKEKITLQKERDLFVSVISSAITLLLREVENATDVYFTTMIRSNWSTLNQVSGQSHYVGELVKAAEQVVETIKPLIEQKRYLRNFLDKVCSVVLAKFTNALVRSKPLKEIGAEQLLLDLQVLKGYLTKMPGENLLTNIYSKALTKTATRLETLLKVIITPMDPKENFILNYTFLIGDASLINFQKILDLKGVPRTLHQDFEDTFLMITSTKTDLDSTSFLSSLDMDPQGGGGGGSNLLLLSPTASRVALPLGSNTISDGGGLFHSLSGGSGGASVSGSSGPATGSSIGGGVGGVGSGEGGFGPGARGMSGETNVFSDFRRFVSFGLRKESTPPS